MGAGRPSQLLLPAATCLSPAQSPGKRGAQVRVTLAPLLLPLVPITGGGVPGTPGQAWPHPSFRRVEALLVGPRKEAAYDLGTLLPPLPRNLPSSHSAWELSPMDPIAQRGQGSLRAPCTGCAPALEATLALCPCPPWPAPCLLQHPFSKALWVPLEVGRWGLDCGRKCGGSGHQGAGVSGGLWLK